MPSAEKLHTSAPHLDELRRQFLEAQLAGDRRKALDLNLHRGDRRRAPP